MTRTLINSTLKLLCSSHDRVQRNETLGGNNVWTVVGTQGGPPQGVLLELKDEKEANSEEPGLPRQKGLHVPRAWDRYSWI